MKPITRWELIKTIAEAYSLYYLDQDPALEPKRIIYNRYGLDTVLSNYRLGDGEYLVLTISPGCFGDNVENIDDIYTWFIDYALADIDFWINELEKALEADKRMKKEIKAG